MEAASLNLPTTAAQANAFMSSIQDSKEGVVTTDASNADFKPITTEVKGEAIDDNTSSGIVPILQNIVATVNLDCRLDLKTIALHARNAEYNPKVSLPKMFNEC